MNENRKRLGSLSLLLLILYGCVVIYFVLFSDRLGRGDGYSTYRYNLVPFEEIRRFIIYRNYVSAGAFLLNLFGNLLVFFCENSLYSPYILNMTRIRFSPIIGKVVCVWRSCMGNAISDSIEHLSLEDREPPHR